MWCNIYFGRKRVLYYVNYVFFSSIGHKWRSHRKLIAPTFHLNVLKSFIDLFNENSRQVCNRLKDEVGKTFDAHDYMSETTVEILLGEFYFDIDRLLRLLGFLKKKKRYSA